MNKSELISSMAQKSNLTKKDTESALNSFMEIVEETLAKGEKIQLVGFGTFEVRHRKAREGRNPQNPKETIHIPECNVPTFRTGKTLKKNINK